MCNVIIKSCNKISLVGLLINALILFQLAIKLVCWITGAGFPSADIVNFTRRSLPHEL